MRRAYLLAAGAALMAAPAFAQAQAPARPAYNPVRYDENWSSFKDPALRSEPFDALKYIALGDSGAYATLGLDWRLRAEFIHNPNFDLSGLPEEPLYGTSRFLAHADLHLNPRLRAFVQLGSHDAFEKNFELAVDDNQLDLQQAFADVSAPIGGGTATVRLGRQEIVAGDFRILNVREGANIRLRWDGARLIYTRGAWRMDAFTARPTKDKPGSWDDGPDQAQEVQYLRLTRTLRNGRVEFGVVDQESARLRLLGPPGANDRQTWFVRGVRNGPVWDFEGALYLQTGDFGGRDVEALGFGVDITRKFKTLKPLTRAVLRINGGSGDSDPRDRQEEGFVPPFPRGSYLNDPSVMGYTNIFYITPMAVFTPWARASVELRTDLIFRQQRADAIYAFPATALAQTAGVGGGAFYAVSPAVFYQQPVGRHLTFQVGAAAFYPQGPLARAGGRTQSSGIAGFAFRY